MVPLSSADMQYFITVVWLSVRPSFVANEILAFTCPPFVPFFLSFLFPKNRSPFLLIARSIIVIDVETETENKSTQTPTVARVGVVRSFFLYTFSFPLSLLSPAFLLSSPKPNPSGTTMGTSCS